MCRRMCPRISTNIQLTFTYKKETCEPSNHSFFCVATSDLVEILEVWIFNKKKTFINFLTSLINASTFWLSGAPTPPGTSWSPVHPPPSSWWGHPPCSCLQSSSPDQCQSGTEVFNSSSSDLYLAPDRGRSVMTRSFYRRSCFSSSVIIAWLLPADSWQPIISPELRFWQLSYGAMNKSNTFSPNHFHTLIFHQSSSFLWQQRLSLSSS